MNELEISRQREVTEHAVTCRKRGLTEGRAMDRVTLFAAILNTPLEARGNGGYWHGLVDALMGGNPLPADGSAEVAVNSVSGTMPPAGDLAKSPIVGGKAVAK